MAKKTSGSLGRKIKMSQPVAIDFTTYITLVEGKVIKGPIAPKMEVMEKWIVSGGRDIETYRNKETGLVHATLVSPGADGPDYHMGEGETMALAVTEAIVGYLKSQPKPDPAGKDLPLFRGNGGVASVAEMGLEGEFVGHIEPTRPRTDADDLFGEDFTVGSGGFDTGDLPPDRDDPDARESLIASGATEMPPDREWTWLHIINPADAKRWKKEAPTFDGSPVVEFEEGDDSNQRGWYLDPDFFYDREVGIITQRNPVPGELAVVWSRDVAPGAVEASRVFIGADA